MIRSILTASGLCLTLAAAVSAQYSFTPVALPALAGSSPSDVEFGDLDGDTRLDIAVTWSGDLNRVSWLKADFIPGENNPSFTLNILGNTTENALVKLGDMRADGDLDVIFAAQGSFGYYMNDGAAAPVFTRGGIPHPNDIRRCVGVGDTDGDGDLDFVSDDNPINDVYLFQSNGSDPLLFAPLLLDGTGGKPTDVEIFDFDNDGDNDIVTVSPSNDRLFFYERLGPDAFPGMLNYSERIISSGGE